MLSNSIFVCLVLFSMACAFAPSSHFMASSTACFMVDEPKPFSSVPDQGSRTTMNPFYQVDKFSVYPDKMQRRRVRANNSEESTPEPAALPQAAAPSTSTDTAAVPEENAQDIASPIPDQGRGVTMNRAYQIQKDSMYPPHMNR